MLQKLKITSCSLIVLLIFVLPSVAYSYSWRIAKSCKGWSCRIEGRICPKGAKGAGAGSYICTKSKWVLLKAESCRGWNCSHKGQICPKGAEGASAGSYICWNYKWRKTPCWKNYAVTLRSFMSIPPELRRAWTANCKGSRRR